MDVSFEKILERATRVVKLDSSVFREIARDPAATKQAAVVVGVVAILSAIGAADDSFGSVIFALIGAFISWFIFSGMTYFFGKSIFGTPTTQVNTESLLRTQGYAQVPGVLGVLGFIPVLGLLIGLIAAILTICTAVLAIRETLTISTGRAIVVAIIAAIASALVVGILAGIFGVGAAIF